MLITDILKKSLENPHISDVILTVNAKPAFKIDGEISYLEDYDKFTNNILSKEISSVMNQKQKEIFKEKMELDFPVELK